ncbi:MAG: radical SAM protein [Christensenellaceae bacterium]|jgi:MoaA/NifB/PqqE/SkfB family radical SAM enzyme|nr:radical SAM protein [Christensenellaceae bacterium]
MSNIKEYRPKSKGQWAITQSKLEQGKIPMLDLQFGGGCNARCVYCDTPNYTAPNNIDMEAIKKIIEGGNIDWVFLCGLGEPTARETGNRDKFKYLLGLAHENGVKVSAFTNIIDIDKEILDYIDNETLSVLHKLDSFNSERVAKTFGINEKAAKKHLENVEILREIASNKHAIDTNIGASIVLTNKNYDEAERLIDHCLENGIFPFYGELENSGKSTGKLYKDLNPTQEQVKRVKDLFSARGIADYRPPLCPSQFASVHIDNNNMVSIAHGSGLACSWCTLCDNNKVKRVNIGDIREKSYEQICDEIWADRFDMYKGLKELAKHTDKSIVGGCGGNQSEVLCTQLNITRKAAKSKGVELEN